MSAQKTTEPKAKRSSALSAFSEKDLDMTLAKRGVDSSGFALWVREYLQNVRQGTVKVKGRSDVAYSTIKPWKQKGTGRARAGSRRSPIWRGGGVIFGPQARTKSLKVSKKLKQGVLNTLFWDFLERGNILVTDWELKESKPKTAKAFEMLKKAGLHESKITLFSDVNDVLTRASFANMPHVKVLSYDAPHPVGLTHGSCWLVLKKDIPLFKKMVSKWI